MADEKKIQDEDLDFVTEPTALEDEDLDEVSGGGCAGGSGCCGGDNQLE